LLPNHSFLHLDSKDLHRQGVALLLLEFRDETSEKVG
jgi:hypothetical protein